jgi:subtilisin
MMGGIVMARQRGRKKPSSRTAANRTSSPADELLLAARERGNDGFETGRNLVTFKEGTSEEGVQSLGVQGMQVVDARDFEGQAATLEDMGDADALVYPEIGLALVGGSAAKERGLNLQAEIARDSPIAAIEPEYFVFAESGFTQPVERRHWS